MDVAYETRQGGAWIEFRRPEALNALSADVVELLDSYICRAAEDDDVRSIVITGTGRAFCAGADLKAMLSMGVSERRDAILGFVTRTSDVFTKIAECPKPVIAAVNGIAVAGGLELIMCCDIVLASDTATFADGHAKYGLLPGAGATVRLPRIVPQTWAKYLLLTGRTITARQGAEIGLVTIVCAPDELENEATALMRDLAARSPLSSRLVKRLASRSTDESLADGLAEESAAVAEYSGSADMAEGLAAFSEKRKPAFIGR
jgi:enoyl-CoA hydratase